MYMQIYFSISYFYDYKMHKQFETLSNQLKKLNHNAWLFMTPYFQQFGMNG